MSRVCIINVVGLTPRLLQHAPRLSALGVATCCVMPMTMMAFGLGGSWLAVFGKIAATSLYVLGLSSVILRTAWLVARYNSSTSRLKWWLLGSAALTACAWVVFFTEARIIDFIITLM